ncbi:MAG: hypothetical protein MUF76_08630 [Hydrogenophaga sp.]|jgi:hypothetical protein|nr:hypothetical protein [Hydrogenophaga sp.]
MSRLLSELLRLYGVEPGGATPGATRCVVVRCARPGAWSVLRPLWQGVQAELDWPAPAIVVDGVDAIELWFSLPQPWVEDQARMLGQTLCTRFLAEGTAQRWQVRLQSVTAEASGMPPQERLAGQWSAFVAPDLAAVFADDPWLDMPPGDDAQAELVSRLRPVTIEALAAVLRSGPGDPPASAGRSLVAGNPSRELVTSPAHPLSSPAGGFTWPSPGPQSARAFLQQVMNDASVPLQWRLDAARALLPHEEVGRDGGSPAP